MPEQLIFDWPVGVSLEASDFFVSAANETAFRMVRDPSRWPQGKLLLIGPEGAGKSHLARVFAQGTDAIIVPADRLRDLHPKTPVVVEDADCLSHEREPNLFHLHNHMISLGLPLLITARQMPARWDMTLPDLKSRMQATVPVQISRPDDALLEAVLMKLFADRQMMPPPDLPRYLASRIDRSYLAAQAIVAQLDARAMATRKPITQRMAATLLQEDADHDR